MSLIDWLLQSGLLNNRPVEYSGYWEDDWIRLFYARLSTARDQLHTKDTHTWTRCTLDSMCGSTQTESRTQVQLNCMWKVYAIAAFVCVAYSGFDVVGTVGLCVNPYADNGGGGGNKPLGWFCKISLILVTGIWQLFFVILSVNNVGFRDIIISTLLSVFRYVSLVAQPTAEGTGGLGPLRNFWNFLTQVAWISSVKYRRCFGRRVLLVGYSSGVPVTQRQRQLQQLTTRWLL